MHSRRDLSCARGFEWWLLREARRRNPRILTYGLLWGMPGWVDNQTARDPQGFDWRHDFGPDMVRYLVSWVGCASSQNLTIDLLGIWNESPWGTVPFVKSLKHALTASGHSSTELVLMDGGLPPDTDPFWQGLADPEFVDAFAAVGFHYPCVSKERLPSMRKYMAAAPGHKLWSSEDFFLDGKGWPGAACWATILNANFLAMNMTSTIAWSAVWSVYGPGMFQDEGIDPQGKQWGPGLIIASSPWSGHFDVTPAAFVTGHTTSFTAPGDRYLAVGENAGSGYLSGGGSYVTLVGEAGSPRRFAMVIETADAQHCNQSLDPGGPGQGNRGCANAKRLAKAPQAIEVVLRGDLAGHSELSVVRSNHARYFAELPRLAPTSRTSTETTFSITLEPGAVYTIATPRALPPPLPAPPADAPFPLPFEPDWTPGATDPATARPRPRPLVADQYAPFFADKAGSWALAEAVGETELVLQQVVPERPGANRWAAHNLDFPLTVVGGVGWGSYTVSVRAQIVQPGRRPSAEASVYLCGWASSPQQQFPLPQDFLFSASPQPL